MNSPWLITSELAKKKKKKVLFTCVVYTNKYYFDLNFDFYSGHCNNLKYYQDMLVLLLVENTCRPVTNLLQHLFMYKATFFAARVMQV